jgi:lyso-ornithine lipid O-acyltransferase
MISYLRALRRIILFVVGTVLLVPVQLFFYLPLHVLRILPRNQSPLVRVWYRYMLWVFGVRVVLVNKRNLGKKQKIFLSNHISYLDIFILGAYFNCFFVAKSDIAGWPIFGSLAKIGGTLFITRERRFLKRQLELLANHLKAKQSLLIFPEGTTSNGQEILPFKSSLLNSVMEMKQKPFIQALTLVYTHMNDKKLITQEQFDQIAWYGDMTMPPHFGNLLRQKNFTARVIIHPPIHPNTESTPKSMTAEAHSQIKNSFYN